MMGQFQIQEQPVATWSTDMKYRYSLIRRTGMGDSMITFIMLNPSTATERVDDPTIRRCQGFARREGHGWLYICNLSPFRATDPKEMISRGPEPEHIWDVNIATILSAANYADEVVVAWGTHGQDQGRDQFVLDELAYFGIRPKCLGKTMHGYPKHPLYIAKDAPLEEYFSDEMYELHRGMWLGRHHE